jgi:hypothetical protein
LRAETDSIGLPSFVAHVVGEVEPGYWKPKSVNEWAEVKKTTAFLDAWIAQQTQERSLRKMIGIWVFVLMTLQVAGVFGLVFLDAWKLLVLNIDIVKFLIPSVLSEVFGLGFVVVKYLFNPASLKPLIFGKQQGGN